MKRASFPAFSIPRDMPERGVGFAWGMGEHRWEPMARILLTASLKWPAAARLAGAFAALGAEVEAFAPRGHAIAASRHVARSHIYQPLRALSGLRRAIESGTPDLIVPCDDRAVRHLLALHEIAPSLAPLIEYSLGRPEFYTQMFSRCA